MPGTESLIWEYKKNLAIYSQFTAGMAALLTQLLNCKDIKYHKIESRTKGVESLRAKLNKSPGKYQSLQCVTDLCGVRVITFFSDDVDRVEDLVSAEFEKDKHNSSDKRKPLDPGHFGYASLHLVVSLHSKRAALEEYQQYAGYKVEIQIRTILQHAWAEIEHDLGYKSPIEIPYSAKRRFSMLASSMESKDKEFNSLQNALEGYRKRVRRRIEHSPHEVGVNKVSLEALLDLKKTARLDDEIRRELSAEEDESPIDMSVVMELLKVGKVKTIGELMGKLEGGANELVNFTKAYGSFVRNKPRGVSLMLIAYKLASDRWSELKSDTALSDDGLVQEILRRKEENISE